MDEHRGDEREDAERSDRSDAGSWRRRLVELAAFVALPLAVAYVLGLGALWIQLSAEYDDLGIYTTWYAASLFPKAAVAGQGIEVLWKALPPTVIVAGVSLLVARVRLIHKTPREQRSPWLHLVAVPISIVIVGVLLGSIALNIGESSPAVPTFRVFGGVLVERLRNAAVRAASKNEVYNDLDCPLRVGDVLILAEVKGKYMARAPETFATPDIVRRRWEENLKLLRKIDQTARLLAARRRDGTFREALEGIRYVLPVVVRPYREWVPDLADEHWLRKPSRPDVGVPRVLIPPELREFLEIVDPDTLANLPGGFVVNLEGV